MARGKKQGEGADDGEGNPETQIVYKDRISQMLASDLFKAIQKKHGDSILMRASDFKAQSRPRISTGIFPLDYALGGGFPVGLVSTVYGDKSASKTTVLCKAIASAQNMCSNCYCFMTDAPWGCKCPKYREFVSVYLDVEGTLDLKWASYLGVDPEKLIVSIPEHAEQTLDMAEAIVRSGECDILALDSLAFLTPSKEIEESNEKDMMGVQARVIGRGIRKLMSAVNEVGNKTGKRPTIFFTNQIRLKLGILFGNPETQPGGKAPGFAAATETRLAQGKTEVDEATGKPIHVEIRFKIEKNKTSGAKMEGTFKLHTADSSIKKIGDITDEDFMVDWGERTGLITGRYQCGGETFRIKADLEQRLQTDSAFKMKLWNELMPIMLQS
jgi:recombination protein RecA